MNKNKYLQIDDQVYVFTVNINSLLESFANIDPEKANLLELKAQKFYKEVKRIVDKRSATYDEIGILLELSKELQNILKSIKTDDKLINYEATDLLRRLIDITEKLPSLRRSSYRQRQQQKFRKNYNQQPRRQKRYNNKNFRK